MVIISWVHYLLGEGFRRRARVPRGYQPMKQVELSKARPLSEVLMLSEHRFFLALKVLKLNEKNKLLTTTR